MSSKPTSFAPAAEPSPNAARRCRRAGQLPPGARRPSEVLAVFFAVAIAMLLAAAVAAVVHLLGGSWWARWVALHLALLGGVSQLVLGAGQFFAAAFLATDPPSRRLVGAQLATWNAGTLLVVVGVPGDQAALTEAGGALIVAGLGLFAAALAQLERKSLQRARWAVRWYYACAGCLVLGGLAGALLARGVSSGERLLGAHLALNLPGWLGTAIVGTLHTFFPSLTGTQLRFGRLQGPTFAAWLLGVLALAAGHGLGVDLLAAAGWLALAVAAVLLAANLLGCAEAARGRVLGLPARLVALGQLFGLAGLLVALGTVLADGMNGPFIGWHRAMLAVLWLAGWIGLTVAGSLLHLLTVLQRVRRLSHVMPAPHGARDRALSGLAALGVSALALSRLPALDDLGAPAAVIILVVLVPLAARVLVLAARGLLAIRTGRA